MINTRKCMLSLSAVSVVVVLVAAIFWNSGRKNDYNISIVSTNNSIDSVVQVRNWDIHKTAEGYFVRGLPVEFLSTDNGMFEAAIKDGICTQAQVENGTCLNNLFYLRGFCNDASTFPVDKDAIVSVYDYTGGGSVSNDALVSVPIDEYIKELYLTVKPLIVELGLDDGVVVRINEIYVP